MNNRKKSDPVPDPVPDGVGKFGSGSEVCYTSNPQEADKLMCLPHQLLCQLQLTLFTFSPEEELGAEGKEKKPFIDIHNDVLHVQHYFCPRELLQKMGENK